MTSTNKTRAVLLGASGLVGGHCLSLLLADPFYDEIFVLTRKPLEIKHPKLSSHVIDFSELEAHLIHLRPDFIFCCLGTTMNQAGSKELFYKVDYEYPLVAAKAALACGTEQFLLVSAMGANSSSSIFYNRTKGQIENALIALNLPSLLIFRPSLLLGDRSEKRLGESIAKHVMQCLSPLFKGPLEKYRAIGAEKVAQMMVYLVQKKIKGVQVIESIQIQNHSSLNEKLTQDVPEKT